jgi:putative nucleotidyltransferase with HDIG domain
MIHSHSTPQAHYITPAQLCVGLYVHLDLSWSEHPFTFSSFKLKNQAQILQVQALRLARIRYSPEKSDVPPVAAASPQTRASIAPPMPLAAAASNVRTLTPQPVIDRQTAHLAKVAACERTLLQSARVARSMAQHLSNRPTEVRAEATQLVGAMAESMLLDADIAIHLMADTLGGEAVYHHALNVTLLAMMLARHMNLPSQSLHAIGLGALFHDAARGAYRLPGHRPDAQHVIRARELCSPLDLPEPAMQVVSQHHEHADGTGYPKGLRAPLIATEAKLVTIADQFDELCNPEDPAKALTPHEALSVMYGQQRQRYDNTAMMTFVRCLGVYPPGTLVQLSNAALAKVLAVNSSRPLKPTVQILQSSATSMQMLMG